MSLKYAPKSITLALASSLNDVRCRLGDVLISCLRRRTTCQIRIYTTDISSAVKEAWLLSCLRVVL